MKRENKIKSTVNDLDRKDDVIQHVQHMAVQGRLEVTSTDHVDLVYKVDYLVQSSLLSSLVLTLIQSSLLQNILNTNNFYFILFYFSDFILFYFYFWTMKRHVTLQSHDMSHEVTSQAQNIVEGFQKMISEYIDAIWWP